MPKTHFSTAAGTNNDWATTLVAYGYPPCPTGNVLFVQSTNPAAANDSDNGYGPDNPLLTIDYAIGRCVPDNEDVIVVLPGHVETVTGAAGVALDVAGVTIIGHGRGRQRPRVNFTTATAASFDVSAARCAVVNLYFTNSIDAQTAMVNVSAADCVIERCEFQLGDASTQAVLGILTTAAASRLRVEGNYLHGTVDAGVTGAIRVVGGDGIVIRGNDVHGAFAVTGAIENVTTATTGIVIDGNTILNQTADGNNKTIVLHASATGLISGNRGGIIDSTAPAPVTAAAAWVAGNHWSSAVGVAASALM